jgi:transposase
MANRLKMAMVDAVQRLLEQGWSHRRIARELGIHRDTVAGLAGKSKPAKAPLGADGADGESKPAKAPLGADPLGQAVAAVDAQATEALSVVSSSSASCLHSSQEKGHAGGSTEALSVVSSSSASCLHSSQEKGQVDGSAASGAVDSRSACEPFRGVILSKLELGLSGQRIYQDLVSDHAFPGSYYSVRRFVQHLGQTRELPFRRLECAPGEEVQVDFGTGIPITQGDGRRRRTHVFRVVLSYSRKAYSEVVERQTTDNFIRCLENAFWYFGGAPQRVVLDNLRAAVQKADWFDPELNPKVQAFAAHYGVVLMPTKPYTPRHKGKVERGVDYVQENGLKGHTFTSLAAENQHLLAWEQGVADTRLHGTTRQQVGKVFREVEHSCLQSLPLARFPFFHEGQRSVHRDGHVEVAKAYYSVPPEYVGRRVWARWDGQVVRVFNQRLEQIALHVQQEPGRFSTHDQHLAAAKISGVERGATWLLTKVGHIGPQTRQWAQAMLEARGIAGVRVLQGLIGLARRHASAALEQACATAYSYGAYRLRTLRTLLERQTPPQALLPFLQEHDLIRPLSEYGELVHSAFTKEREA